MAKSLTGCINSVAWIRSARIFWHVAAALLVTIVVTPSADSVLLSGYCRFACVLAEICTVYCLEFYFSTSIIMTVLVEKVVRGIGRSRWWECSALPEYELPDYSDKCNEAYPKDLGGCEVIMAGNYCCFFW